MKLIKSKKGIRLAMGIVSGVVLGLLTSNIALWLSIGIAIGAALEYSKNSWCINQEYKINHQSKKNNYKSIKMKTIKKQILLKMAYIAFALVSTVFASVWNTQAPYRPK